MALIGFVEKEYRVDSGRIYLTGISMGGRGVLYLAYKYPRKFAAVGALAPYSTAWGKGLSATPVLIIHGQNDVTAPVEGSRDLAKAILEANGDVEFRVLPERGHDIANLYDGNEVYDWLLKHRR
jgi:predicted peptidase